MLIFDKELKAPPTPRLGTGIRGDIFSATPQGTIYSAGSPHLSVPSSATPPMVPRWGPAGLTSSPKLDVPFLESWSEG